MQKAEKKLNVILKKTKSAGISPDKLLNLKVTKYLCSDYLFRFQVNNKSKLFKISFGFVLLYVVYSSLSVYSSQCWLEMPLDTTKVFRKPENCLMCTGITQIDRVKNISQADFEDFYAHTGIPVVISDGTREWSAQKTFSFKFFKQLYQNSNFDHENVVNDCQFFPYKTEFNSLAEVFNMSDKRSRLEPGTEPWYVGWSNCNDRAGKVLRQHYNRPYFLPENSENIALSWIFMGGPGNGAHMHVDNVVHPSWQAQLSGKKRWRLMPPPECIYQCAELSVTVQPGEIIVVDTNRWYHQTHIIGGDISITIGSEFD